MGGTGIVFYFILIILGLEYYSFQAFRNVNQNVIALWVYILIHVLLYGGLLYMNINGRAPASSAAMRNSLIILSLLVIPKIFIAIIFIIDDILRLIQYGVSSLGNNTPDMPSRRKMITWLGLGIAAIPFIGVLDGIIFGKYRYRVIRKQVFFDDLPEEFDGFTITQISDIHSGSFDDPEKVKYGVELANAQKSDVLVFTGDMVNSVYTEFEPYVDMFSVLTAKEGMFAILGNHDYAVHSKLDAVERRESVNKLQDLQRKVGFEPLNNEMRTIERNGKRLNIVGVENWGNSEHFPKEGDLKKATAGVKQGDFNVLLSHDPSHFDHDLKEYDNVINFPKKMHLTLSGHTHGMQFGIEIPGLVKWSPVKYRYHNWAGLYEENQRKLYVNRGFGYLAFPGRVGIWPEITVLELKKKV
ncbi:metallophosphoesterase [Flavobacteriaceae bacterium Ap0902]|nr:metallophosphoesterase [Flavobacteriaceae bacterium Ap0902]